MPNMLFANNCNTTLSSSLTNVATTMSVTSATGFPSPTGSQYFYCTLADAATQTTIEIVKVTAVSGTTFTIVRGQDGTTGTIFASGAVVSLRLVAASLNDFPKLDEANTFTGTITFSTPLLATNMVQSTTSTNGYLSSTDWNTFNSKQAALVSGTNIKTVGGVSLLGSGDVGAIGVSYGGTGLTSTPSNGALDIGNGTNFTRSTLTAGSGISITNGSGSITITNTAPSPYSASYLVIAGGGGGGSNRGGGGGAGGLLTGTVTLNVGTVYSITVGGGGASGSASVGGTGVNSVLSGTGITTQTALGGGGGAYISTITGVSGGSGGGGAFNGGSGGSGTSGQGFGGGSGSTTATVSAGGGGGASAVGGTGLGGVTGGVGGAGTSSSITGSAITYAGGGGGSSETVAGGAGGAGGGGTGATNGVTNATDGTANTGGGGGGGYPNAGGAGGSGVVILSVPTVNYTGTTTGSPTVTTSGSNTIIKFTASGSYTA